MIKKDFVGKFLLCEEIDSVSVETDLKVTKIVKTTVPYNKRLVL